MMLAAAGMMGRLKRMAIGADAVPHLLERGRGTGEIQRELNWWLDEARLNAADNDPHFVAVAKLHDWLVSNQPAVRPASLTHGDGQIANMMFKDGQIVAWLDWELAYLGHQESDLMMVIMMTEMTNRGDGIEGVPSEAEYVARFEAESGAPVEHFPYFKLLMIYKYFVGLLFSKELLQDFDQHWRAIEDYRDKVLPLAEADARSGH
jgi:aminoglycoside phosphotransferase (APT) family kinase protein